MRKSKARVLVADDEARYVRAIKLNLEASGFEVVTAADGQAALELAADAEVDLVILDVRMPRLDGYEACRRIREFSSVPIILLTAMAQEADKVKGLDLGADDYVTKPFSANELLARVRAVLRRGGLAEGAPPQAIFQRGDLTVDYGRQRVFIAGREVDLTATEYRLLCELARHAGQVLVPDYLLERVWGSAYVGENRLVWQAIHRLRQKIEPVPNAPRYIENKPGIGYVLTSPDD